MGDLYFCIGWGGGGGREFENRVYSRCVQWGGHASKYVSWGVIPLKNEKLCDYPSGGSNQKFVSMRCLLFFAYLSLNVCTSNLHGLKCTRMHILLHENYFNGKTTGFGVHINCMHFGCSLVWYLLSLCEHCSNECACCALSAGG